MAKKRLWAVGLTCLLSAVSQAAPQTPYAFGVLNHRSLQATAAYWNPILNYVSMRSGVPLELHIGRTANETTDRAVAGQLDFAYTNHLFTPRRDKLGWRVLARQDSPGIRAQIVVLDASPVRTLQQLESRTVAFANPYGVTGYAVPMDLLMRTGVSVMPVFAGNQEASMGQLVSGQVAAAGVSHQVMADFARRKQISYRVLAESETFHDLAIMASPRIGADEGEKVRQAFVSMGREPEGRAVLRQAAQALGLPHVRGFVPANDRDYNNYRSFFKYTHVPTHE